MGLADVAVDGAALAQAAVLDSVEDHSGVSRLDQPPLNWMLGHRSADLTLLAKTVSVLGSTVTWAVLVALWLSWRRNWLDALGAAVGAGGFGCVRRQRRVAMWSRRSELSRPFW
jgi:hypothetical protein